MPETITLQLKDLPVIRPQVINIGDDWEGEIFGHTNPDGSPIDLTGAVIVGKLQLPGGEVIDLIMEVDVLAGTYKPTLPAATTAEFTPGRAGRFDIDMTDSLGKKHTYWAGPVTFKATLPPQGA